jgi:hypothetical protein
LSERASFLPHTYNACLVCNDEDNEFGEVLASPQREIPGSDFRVVRMGFVVEKAALGNGKGKGKGKVHPRRGHEGREWE